MASKSGNLLWKFWYPLLTRLTRSAPVTFLNYGYAQDSGSVLELDTADEIDRACIQLYNAVVRPVDLKGRTVLEISCGHGGGASYIARYFHPESMQALDRNPAAISLCLQRHDVPNLSFCEGNAQALHFPNENFDAVVNVEASHCYPDMPKFLEEVARVLKPNGNFLYTDFRTKTDAPMLQQQLETSGLTILTQEDISPHVIRGMHLNTEKYLRLINDLVPAPLRSLAKRFAGVPGSAIYNELLSGETVYLRYVLQKATPAA